MDEVLEDAIDAHLRNPSVDPHGDPIPSKDGIMPDMATTRLVEQPVQRPSEVVRVLTQDRDKPVYLGSIGLRPRAKVAVQEKMPYQYGPYAPVDRRRGDHCGLRDGPYDTGLQHRVRLTSTPEYDCLDCMVTRLDRL